MCLVGNLVGWLTLCLIDTYSREARGLIKFEKSIFIWKIQGRWHPETTNQFGLALLMYDVSAVKQLYNYYRRC